MITQPFFVPAMLIAVLSLPLIAGAIPRQWGYGYRTPKTLSDDKIWYPANRVAGLCFLISSLVYFAVAALLPSSTNAGTGFNIWLVHLLSFAGPLVLSILYVRKFIETL